MKTKTAFMSYNKGLETWSFWKTKEDAKIGKKDDERDQSQAASHIH